MLDFVLTALLATLPAQAQQIASQAPPSGADLDALIKDYEVTSQNFANSLQVVQVYVPNCGSYGDLFAQKMAEAVPAAQAQRKRVLDALKQAQADLDAQSKALAGTIGGQAGAGQAAVLGAANVIQAGVAKPSKVIDEEVAGLKPRLQQMESNLSQARWVLSENNPACKTASKTFESGRTLGLSIPGKLQAIKSALADRRTSLLSWAGEIQKSLVSGMDTASVAQNK